MAYYNIFTYTFINNNSLEWFRQNIKGSSNVIVILNDKEYAYIYDEECNLLHLENGYYGDDINPSMSLEKAMENEVKIVSMLHLNLPVEKIRKVIDYSAMITDLYSRGKVKVRPSNNIMTVDGRKFKFIDDGEEWEVDALGTTMAIDISQRVTNEWAGLK